MNRHTLKRLSLRLALRTANAQLMRLMLACLVGITAVAGMGMVSLYDMLLNSRKEQIATLLGLLRRDLDALEAEVRAGALTRDAAQALARDRLAARNTPDQYYFVRRWDRDELLVHPTSSRVGRADRGMLMKDGRYISQVYRDAIAGSPDGLAFVTMKQRRPDNVAAPALDKLNGVTLYEPWGWILGTGVFLADMRQTYWTRVGQFMLPAGGLIVVFSVIMLMLHRRISASTRRIKRQQRRLLAAERRLTEQLARQSALVESIPYPVFVCDTDARLLDCNSACSSTFGVERAEAFGQRLATLSPAPLAADMDAAVRKVGSSGEGWTADRSFERDGAVLSLFLWAVPLLDADGSRSGVVGGAMDVSERVRAQQTIEAARIEAERASMAKTAFFASLSHEIRTPMNAVIGVLELLLQKKTLFGENRQAVQLAYNAAESMLELIDSTLDLARIESGKLQLSLQPCALAEIVDEVATMFSPLAWKKGLQILAEIDPRLPARHLADPLRVKQILNNLVSNAVKYSHAGQVRLMAAPSDPAQPDGPVELVVEDSGQGIDEAELGTLFQPFVRASSAGLRVQGAGLGLSIVRHLVDLMGGKISITSARGTGTRIAITLLLPADPAPGVAAADDRPATRPDAGALEGRHALIVDDHPVNLELLYRQLSFLGLRVTRATGGEAAFEAFQHGSFDVVITDFVMPGMDGCALAVALRRFALANGRTPTPVIGCTADTQSSLSEKVVDAHLAGCLFKPIRLAPLRQALLRVFAPEHGEREPEAGADSRAPQGLLDMRSLKEVSTGDAAIEGAILRTLRETNDQDLSVLSRLAADGDIPGVSATVHRIKGAARVVGVGAVVTAAEALEHALAQAGTGGYSAELDALVDSVRRMGEEIDQYLQSRGTP